MSTSRASPALALRFAARELRGGLAGFLIFLAVIALGVAAIAAVGSVSRAMTDALSREGAVILGGDVSVSLVQRRANDEERAFIAAAGPVSEIATLRGMARRLDGSDEMLVEVKAIDAAYPLKGDLVITAGGRALSADRPLDALVDPELLVRLGLAVGDEIALGAAHLRIAGTIASEPDKLSGGLGFGPRLLISRAALDATRLLQPGSLVQWSYRIVLPADTDPQAFRDAALARFPEAGWQIRTRTDATPGLRQSIARFSQYLTLVGFAALVVGGVGIANAVGAFIEQKRPAIATYRALGASAGFVVFVYLIEIMIIALAGVAIGLAAGALVTPAALRLLANILPVGAESGFYPAQLGEAALFGLMTALAFTLTPLGRIRDVQPASLFREGSAGPVARVSRPFLAASLGIAALTAAFAVFLAEDRRIALSFVVTTAVVFLLLRGIGFVIMQLSRRVPRPRSTPWRLAIGNIHRPGALTPSVVLSLGLGLTVLVTVTLIDGSLRTQLMQEMPQQSPSFYFIDVPSADLDRFSAFLTDKAPHAVIESVPMLRGRIISLAGVPAAAVKVSGDVGWVLEGDRGVTFAASPPRNTVLTAGAWWPADYAGPPLVSLEASVAAGLGLKLGDSITVNVLGRPITAKIANFRKVDWESLAINFVMVFSPNTFAGAPYSALTTLAFPGGGEAAREAVLMKEVATGFPSITTIRVREALARVSDMLGQLMLAIRLASSLALAASLLVLGGALAAGQRRRLHDAVILKTLGATRRQLVAAFTLEYGLLGIATALFGVAAGSLAAYGVVAGLMRQSFHFSAGAAFLAALGAVAVTLALGLAGTWRLLGRKAAPVLRNL